MGSNVDFFENTVIGNLNVFEDIDEAIEKYNKSTDFLDKLKQLKYIYEKFFDYLSIEKNSGVLLALIEASTVFVKSNYKLSFDKSTCSLSCPFSQGDILLFNALGKDDLYFSCYSDVAGEKVSNVLILNERSIKGSATVIGKNGIGFSLGYNPDGMVDSYTIIESDDKGINFVKTITHCYEEGFIKIVSNNLNVNQFNINQFYDFKGKKIDDFTNVSVDSMDFNIVFSPFVPYFGRHLEKQAQIELNEKMIVEIFPELGGKFKQK